MARKDVMAKKRVMAGFEIRDAVSGDLEHIIPLLPRLADFEIPEGREADELWAGDKAMMLDWANGERNDISVFVAIACVSSVYDVADDSNVSDSIVGVSAVSWRNDAHSGKSSAHLEILALDKSVEGMGLGKRLLERAELHAIENDASSMTLHVYAVNNRARKLYEKIGFEVEVIRYNKNLQN